MQQNLSILGFYRGPFDNISSIYFYRSLIAFGGSAGVPVPKAEYIVSRNIAAPSSPMTTTLCRALHEAALAAMSSGAPALSRTSTISRVVSRTAVSPVASILSRASALVADEPSSGGLVSAGQRTSAGTQPSPTLKPSIDRGSLNPMDRLPTDGQQPDGGEEILYVDEGAPPADGQKIPTWAWAAGAGLLVVVALVVMKKQG
jgi:hypothetical protein